MIVIEQSVGSRATAVCGLTCDFVMGAQTMDNFVRIRTSSYKRRVPILGDLDLVEVTKVDGYTVLNGIQHRRCAMASVDGKER